MGIRIFLVILYLSYCVNCDLVDVFENAVTDLGDGFSHPTEILPPGTVVPDVKNITNLIPPTAFFFDQNLNFRRAIAHLKAVLLKIKDPYEFLATARALRRNSKLHPRILNRALLGVILNRDDRANFRIPTLLEAEPDSALTLDVVAQLKAQLAIPASQRECVRVDEFTGADNLVENALWYFREDPLVNSHHWFWHLYYPIDSDDPRDRRGELFYSMHHSLLARYHAERLSNFLPPISLYALEKNGTVPEGYNAHMTETNAKQNWADRPPLQMISDTVETAFKNLSVDETILWRTRILGSIDTGSLLLPNGSSLPLRNGHGIDVIADAIEASVFNPNPAYCGKFGYHNAGHFFLGNVMNPHDPTSAHPPGVMSETATAMRDPIFYRWHTHVDQIFQKHKATLPPYQPSEGEFALTIPGISIDSIQVRMQSEAAPENVLNTFWTSTTYNLTNGLGLAHQSNEKWWPVQVCVKHLNHADFEYNINVTNADSPAKATVRIFLAPRNSDLGTRYTMKEQHKLFFELDTFSVDLTTGANLIRRQSTDSTLTITTTQGLEELNHDQALSSVYCGCGWPHYMLLPKGRAAPRMTFDLFVMVTQDGAGSSIPPVSSPPTLSTVNRCQEAYLYCGSFLSKYPDSKPMGYPFDRVPYSVTDKTFSLRARMVRDLDEYMRLVPNMASTQVQIIHVDSPAQ